MLFDWGENEFLRAWTLNTSTGVATFLAKGAELASAQLADPTHPGLGGMPGGMLALSANGNQSNTGIVWTTAPIDGDANHDVVEGIVRAYDANTLDTNQNTDGTPRLKLLWTSKMIPNNTFRYSKFCPPFVADGKLFVTTYAGRRVDVYGPK
jgi:outer membrane protein assembly factor BamB